MENFTKKFNDSFLTEMPEKIIVGKSMFSNIVYEIGDLIESGIYPTKLNGNLASIELTSVAYFWYCDNSKDATKDRKSYLNSIQVAVSMNKTGYNYTVSQVGKKEGSTFSPADLYLDILDSGKSKNIRLTSDKAMSAGGLNVWKEILKNHKLSYYDSENPSTLTPINDEVELKSLFGTTTTGTKNYGQFQYVLSESKLDYLDCRALFALRETKRLAGYPDYFL